jgi:hypothetical protein
VTVDICNSLTTALMQSLQIAEQWLSVDIRLSENAELPALFF